MLDLSSLSRTSRRLRTDTLYFIDHIVRHLLSQYVDYPRLFLDAMEKTGALIGGTTALQFLLRRPTGAHGLNVFVSVNHVEPLVRELHSRGFSLLPTTPPTRTTLLSGICSILRYTRQPGRPSINLMLTAQDDVLLAFARAFTTAAMTYIGPNSLHTVYPHLTFERRALIPRQPYHDLPAATGSLRPANYEGAAGVHMQRLLAEGFDIKYYYDWDSQPCGSACGVIQNSIQSRTSFHMTYSGIDSFPGRNTRFVLRTECRNPFCNNHNDVMCVILTHGSDTHTKPFFKRIG